MWLTNNVAVNNLVTMAGINFSVPLHLISICFSEDNPNTGDSHSIAEEPGKRELNRTSLREKKNKKAEFIRYKVSVVTAQLCNGVFVAASTDRCATECLWLQARQVCNGMFVAAGTADVQRSVCGCRHGRCATECLWLQARQVCNGMFVAAGTADVQRSVCGCRHGNLFRVYYLAINLFLNSL